VTSILGECHQIDWWLCVHLVGRNSGERNWSIKHRMVRRCDPERYRQSQESLQNSQPNPISIPVSTVNELHSNSLGMAHSFNPSIAIADTNERYVSANAVYAQQFHRSPSELLGGTIREMVGDDNYQSMKPHLDRAFSGEQSTQSVAEATTDGVTTYRQVSYDPQLSADGQVTGVMIVAMDITDSKRRESDLRESNEFSRAILESSPDCVKVLNEEGDLMSMNAKGMCLMEIDDLEPFRNQAWWSYWPEQAQGTVRKSLKDARENGEGRFEAECPTVKGTPKWWDVIVTPVRRNSGEVKQFVAVSRDVTTRRLHKQELEEREKRLHRVIDNMNSFVGIVDLDGVLQEVNQTAIDAASVAREDVIGRPFCEAFWWSHDDQVAEQVKSSVQAAIRGETSRFDIAYRIAGDSSRMVDVSFVPVRDESGRDESGPPLYVVASGFDVTDRYEFERSLKDATDAAEQANRAKSQFLANMSHEIRTPMTSILGYADLISQKQIDEDTRSHVATIRRNGAFLLGLINDILDLSKIEADHMEVFDESVNLIHLIEDVLSIMQVRAAEKDLEIRVDYCGKIPREIQADSKRLRQILVNLVGNAVKFTEAGHVRVAVRAEQSDRRTRVHFDVVDTGIGISDERMKKLFQPFSQGDPSIMRTYGGTGLGLVISQRLVAMLGGEITARSRVNEGSCFSFCIDAGQVDCTSPTTALDQESIRSIVPQPPQSESALSESDDGLLPPSLDCQVLVADDRRDIRYLLKRILAGAGASVDEVEDGQQAVDHIAQTLSSESCPQVVILDMQMPNLDGFEATQELRTLGYTGLIIALTADAMDGDRQRCLDCGCDDYMSKPIDSAKLIGKIAGLLKPTGVE